MKPTHFQSAHDFRAWLEENHALFPELLIGFYKKSSGKLSITYPEALDEALCFGWIDGVRRNVNAGAYTIRFTPRKPKSQWSAVNIRHVERLTQAGRMCPAGIKAFQGATEQSRKYSYEQRNEACFDKESDRRFRAHRAAWDFFQSQPPGYRRTATFWVVSAKKEETRQRRLEVLIAAAGSGRRIDPLAPLSVPKRR